MPYAKTVILAIVVCFLALQIITVIRAVFGVVSGIVRQKATGIGFNLTGFKEAVILSVLSGWIIGSAWYLLRQR